MNKIYCWISKTSKDSGTEGWVKVHALGDDGYLLAYHCNLLPDFLVWIVYQTIKLTLLRNKQLKQEQTK